MTHDEGTMMMTMPITDCFFFFLSRGKNNFQKIYKKRGKEKLQVVDYLDSGLHPSEFQSCCADDFVDDIPM